MKSSNPIVRIALISDLHTTQKGKSKRILSEAFTTIREQGANFVICAGDNTNGGQAAEFEALQDSVNNHLPDTPFLAALGNHDYFANDLHSVASLESRKQFLNGMFQQSDSVSAFRNGNYSIWFYGIHIIFLDCINDNKNFRFGDEAEDWLTAELEKSRNERFSILVNHIPLSQHNLGRGKLDRVFMAGNNKLQKVIDRFSNVIYISGHTHYSLDSAYPSAEQDENGNIYINASSVGNAQVAPEVLQEVKRKTAELSPDDPEYKKLHKRLKASSLGWLLDVYEGGIKLAGYDFARKIEIRRSIFKFAFLE